MHRRRMSRTFFNTDTNESRRCLSSSSLSVCSTVFKFTLLELHKAFVLCVCLSRTGMKHLLMSLCRPFSRLAFSQLLLVSLVVTDFTTCSWKNMYCILPEEHSLISFSFSSSPHRCRYPVNSSVFAGTDSCSSIKT
jgi:hypothetical protein